MNPLRSLNRISWLVVAFILIGLVIGGNVLLRGQGKKPSPSPSVQPEITWSAEKIEIILSPGESTSRNITFTSSIALLNAVIEPLPEIDAFLSLQPNAFGNITGGEQQPITLFFSISEGTALGTYDGTIHVRAVSQTLPQTLPSTLKVIIAIVSEVTAEHMLIGLADELVAGDIEAALKRFAPTEVNRDTLTKLDSQKRNQLASTLRSLRLVSARDNLRIYHGVWLHEDRSTTDIDFTLAPNEKGEWIIVNW